ncbi:MAG: hypothetical protein Q8P49_03855, partial [Candidatus Liptonbacteria bacterium]|nr:hypothetical protein [Candidatus Liptonbacteria bacterium]
MELLRKLKKVKFYASMPEMRMFWIFLVPFIVVGVLLGMYVVPSSLALAGIGMLVVSAAIIFV